MTGTLILSRTTDASGTADNKPALIVGGASTAAHIEIDSNEILAKTNGTTPSTLYLQDETGTVSVAGSGGLAVSATTASSSTTTGALRVSGGAGIAKNLWVGGYVVGSNGIYNGTGKHYYTAYDGTDYAVIRNYNNGNMAYNACSGGIYLGWADTVRIHIGSHSYGSSLPSSGATGQIFFKLV